MTSSTDLPIHLNSSGNANHNSVNNDYLLLDAGRAYSNTGKQNRNARRSATSTSSALALLAFLFFLNMLQRSLDDNKQQGPMVMTRTTSKPLTKPRNDFTENKQSSFVTTTRNNILITKFENIFKKYFK